MIDEWLGDQPTKRERVIRGITALWYVRVHRKLRIWGVIHWLANTAMASSAPFVAWFFYSTISGVVATTASFAIFIGHSVTTFLNYASKAKGDGDRGVVAVTTRFGELMQSFPRGQAQIDRVDDHIRSALGIIESVALDVTGSPRGSISVCLALYEEPERASMLIRHRHPGSMRRSNKSFVAAGTIAHHACASGTDPRVVNDIKDFGPQAQQSPTQSAVNYRSIYIIPVVRTGCDNGEVAGFISIDSTKPYAFYGNKANSIIVVCEPIIYHIQDMLKGGEQ